jgi:hypothetical protein
MTKTWPKNGLLKLGAVDFKMVSNVTMLGYSKTLEFVKLAQGIQIKLPSINQVNTKWAWVVVIEIV